MIFLNREAAIYSFYLLAEFLVKDRGRSRHTQSYNYNLIEIYCNVFFRAYLYWNRLIEKCSILIWIHCYNKVV